MARDSNPAGNYDPIPARLFTPNRELVNRAPRVTGWTYYCERHIRVMSGLSREANIQKRQDEVGYFIFRCRRDDVTEQLTGELGCIWRGRKYAITGVGYPNLDEIEFTSTPTTENYEPAAS